LDYKALITAIELKGRVINRSDMYAISDSIKNALHTHWDKVKARSLSHSLFRSSRALFGSKYIPFASNPNKAIIATITAVSMTILPYSTPAKGFFFKLLRHHH